MILDPRKETMGQSEIAQLQLEGLQATLNRVYKNVRHYRKVFREIDFVPEDLKSLDDLSKLPFVTRRDLARNYPYEMFAVPLREVVRLHTTTFYFDDPVVVGFTKNDLSAWSGLIARNLGGVGVTADDVVQIAMNFATMAGPFGFKAGAERIGASVIPMFAGKFDQQVKILRDFRTTVLVSTPTAALEMAAALEKAGIDPHELALKRGIFGGEPWDERERKEIESALHITATDTYGLTEVFGPGIAWECTEKNGLHIAQDHFIVEIIDPVSGDVLPPGSEGELVITTISKEAYPLIRFRTGDITSLDTGPCPCGRTHARIRRIFRRSNDLVVARGTSITSDQIAKIIESVCGMTPRFQLVVERPGIKDELYLLVEISDSFFFDEMRRQRRFVEDLHRAVSEFLGWEVNIRLVESGSFDPERKIVDKRRFI